MKSVARLVRGEKNYKKILHFENLELSKEKRSKVERARIFLSPSFNDWTKPLSVY